MNGRYFNKLWLINYSEGLDLSGIELDVEVDPIQSSRNPVGRQGMSTVCSNNPGRNPFHLNYKKKEKPTSKQRSSLYDQL